MSAQRDYYEVSFNSGKTWQPISFRQLADWLGEQDIKAVWNGEIVNARSAQFKCTITGTEARNVQP